MRGILILAAIVALACPRLSRTNEVDQDADSASQFEKQIRPVLATQCLKCHGEDKQEGNLRLDSLDAMLEGGDSGPAVVQGKPEESLVMEALRYESFEMPPTGQLPEKDIQQFKTWIAHGAGWPSHAALIRPAARQFTDADRNWWAFRPLSDPEVPSNGGNDWSLNPIDRFVFHRLSAQEMRPAPRAEETVLVRRLYLDLIGLPPTPGQIADYLQGDPATRWERLIDQLLEDPAYGEHWGRYWLDIVRYAESDGWNQDAYRSSIWRYRDYVIRSFNDDRPYPEFVQQQLAGDEMPGDEPENLAATGFLRLGIYEYNQRDAKSHWNDIVNELTDVTGDVFLGLGMSCARCHDHKFDPLLQTDYYQLRAFFEPLVWRDDLRYASGEQRAEYQQQLQIWKEATADIQARIDALLQPYHERKWKSTVDKFPLSIQACFHKPAHERTSWEHQMAYLVERQFEEEGGGPLAGMSKDDKKLYEELKKELTAFDQLKPDPLPELMTATDFFGPAAPTLIPGDPRQTPIAPGFPAVLQEVAGRPAVSDGESAEKNGRRTALALWIADPENPLTSRVIVNRIWQQHFGRGLVATANDFGHLGQRPTHPELLDWLTRSFVQNGWSLKRLHKLILTSATWQQSACHPRAEDYQRRDPAEELLWRSRVRRLSAEQIRDAMLSVTGELQLQVGGPSVADNIDRRSLYLKSFRNRPQEFLHAFDMANGLKSVAERDTTTTPIQALLMFNGPYCLERASRLADRLQKKGFPRCEDLMRYAFGLTWGRSPSPAELAQACEFNGVADPQQKWSGDQERLVDFCHVLLNSNEFVYVD